MNDDKLPLEFAIRCAGDDIGRMVGLKLLEPGASDKLASGQKIRVWHQPGAVIENGQLVVTVEMRPIGPAERDAWESRAKETTERFFGVMERSN